MKTISTKLKFKYEKTGVQCPICASAKAKRRSIGKEGDEQYKAKARGETLHADLIGKVSVYDPVSKRKYQCPTHAGALYVLVVTDEFTHCIWTFLLRTKDEASRYIQDLIEFIYNQYGIRPKRFQSDGGGEFVNDELIMYFQEWKIEFTKSPAHTRNFEVWLRIEQKELRLHQGKSEKPLHLPHGSSELLLFFRFRFSLVLSRQCHRCLFFFPKLGSPICFMDPFQLLLPKVTLYVFVPFQHVE